MLHIVRSRAAVWLETMANRPRFSRERLMRAGSDTALAAQPPGAVLRCVYREPPGKVTKTTDVAFEWHAQVGIFESRDSVTVKAGKATTMAVPLPTSWRTAFDCAIGRVSRFMGTA